MLSKLLLVAAPALAIRSEVPRGSSVLLAKPQDDFEQSRAAHAGDWSYDNPKKWGGECNGDKQSPIDIKASSPFEKGTAHVEQTGNLRMRDLMHYTPAETSLTFENNGHSIATVNAGQKGSVIIDNEDFKLVGFNFHFPSEHTIDGKRAAGEMHIVHAKSIKDPMHDKLLVASVLIEEAADGEEASPFFENVGFKELSGLTVGKTKTVEKAKVQIFKDLNATVLDNFWHYEGSLTTPPCTQSVQWFVMQKPVKIAKATAEEFKKLFPGSSGNARPVQLFNKRILVADTPFIVLPNKHEEHVWKRGSAASVGLLGAVFALFLSY